ncbi:MAG: hypothetical protein H0U90_03055 [Actinobacteria bacterium]|nr:hypothetical protein [Actinomycetota bacterium]
MPGRSLTWLVLAVLALVFLLTGGSAVLAKVNGLPQKVEGAVASGGGAEGQSASQISSAEFAEAGVGTSSASLRSLVGKPEAKDEHEVEGLRLECWYYGAGSKTGAYQFCFQNGRLRSKFSYP